MSDKSEVGKKRFTLFATLFALTSLLVLARYGYLMLFARQPARPVPTAQIAGRGPILDRNGRILALETRLGDVTLWRPEMGDPVELSRELAHLLDQTPDELLARITSAQTDFMYLRRQVNDTALRQIEDGIRRGRFRGVGIEPVVGRIYPERNLAAQIIGFAGNENNGLAGIEFAFDSDLKPDPGCKCSVHS